MLVTVQRLLLIALLVIPISTWALEPEVQAARDEGMRLWGISEWIKMQPNLEQAADAGDVEAMYYLGEATRLLDRGLSQRAMAWYLQAAEQGDPYAMLRLFQGGACTAGDRCPDGYEDWHHAALAIAQPQAEAGDAEAMMALYYIYANLDASRFTWIYHMLDIPTRADRWLKRSAEAGLPEAQALWGQQIRGARRGWYFTSHRRLAAAEEWFRRAAEQGYVPGMSGLAYALIAQDRYDEGWEWMQIASEHGHAEQRFGVGWCYLDPQRDGRCRNEVDKVKGWAILYSLAVETHYDLYKWAVRDHRDKLTENEVEEAEALAEEEWIGREPPLSRFPPRFGY